MRYRNLKVGDLVVFDHVIHLVVRQQRANRWKLRDSTTYFVTQYIEQYIESTSYAQDIDISFSEIGGSTEIPEQAQVIKGPRW